MKLTKKEKQILYKAATKVCSDLFEYKFYEFSDDIKRFGFSRTPDFPTDLQLFRSLLLLLFKEVGETY